jgi:uncharacterized Zn-finger protein
MAAFETIITEQAEVACEGGGGPLGHPRVYLHIRSENGSVTCPYCSRTYLLKEAADSRAARHG